jgi:hypothetical protein
VGEGGRIYHLRTQQASDSCNMQDAAHMEWENDEGACVGKWRGVFARPHARPLAIYVQQVLLRSTTQVRPSWPVVSSVLGVGYYLAQQRIQPRPEVSHL